MQTPKLKKNERRKSLRLFSLSRFLYTRESDKFVDVVFDVPLLLLFPSGIAERVELGGFQEFELWDAGVFVANLLPGLQLSQLFLQPVAGWGQKSLQRLLRVLGFLAGFLV